MNRFGCSQAKAKTIAKRTKGFQTGDIVKADVPKGKKKGTYTGRVSVRRTGLFKIRTQDRTVNGISRKHCRLLQRTDGYVYYSTG